MLQCSPWEHLGGLPPPTSSCQQHAFALVGRQGELGPHSHARSTAQASTATYVAVPLEVAEPLAVPAPLLVPVAGGEGGLLPPPDAVALRVTLVVLEVVGDRVRVALPLGDLEVDALPLPLTSPLSVGEGREEEEGVGEKVGVPGVGTRVALAGLEGDTLALAGLEGDSAPDWEPLGVDPAAKEGDGAPDWEPLGVDPPAKEGDRVAVMVWVAEVGRVSMQHTACLLDGAVSINSPPRTLTPSVKSPNQFTSAGFDAIHRVAALAV